MARSSRTKSEQWISGTLRFGVWASAAIMLVGLTVASFQTGTIALPDSNPTLYELVAGLSSKSFYTLGSTTALTLMYAGLVLLMLTPFLRVLAALLAFLIEKEWKYVGVSFLVFGMLLAELIVAFQ